MNSNDKERPMEMAGFFDSVADTYEGHMLSEKSEFYARIFESVIETEEELAAMQLFVEKQKKHRVEVSLLSTEQARDKEPALSENIVGATFSPLDSQANPIMLTLGFLRSAQAAGAQFFADTAVRDIELIRNRVAAVHRPFGIAVHG